MLRNVLDLSDCIHYIYISGCANPMGLSDGSIITGTQVWTSSELYTGGVYSSRHAAALGFTGPAELGKYWSPSPFDTNPFIQVT